VAEPIKFKDIRHIIHVAILVVLVLVGFLTVRALTVPESFGQYGHYRGTSLEERQNLDVILLTPQTCTECHEDERGDWWPGFEAWQNGGHSSLTCANCHGNLNEHVERRRKDPTAEKFVVTKDDSWQLCLVCHHAMAARPAVLPIFDPAREDHANYLKLTKKEMEEVSGCSMCHPTYRPHNPELPKKKNES
jgi:hypothetical protein